MHSPQSYQLRAEVLATTGGGGGGWHSFKPCCSSVPAGVRKKYMHVHFGAPSSLIAWLCKTWLLKPDKFHSGANIVLCRVLKAKFCRQGAELARPGRDPASPAVLSVSHRRVHTCIRTHILSAMHIHIL